MIMNVADFDLSPNFPLLENLKSAANTTQQFNSSFCYEEVESLRSAEDLSSAAPKSAGFLPSTPLSKAPKEAASDSVIYGCIGIEIGVIGFLGSGWQQ